jgi:hypothetical protein
MVVREDDPHRLAADPLLTEGVEEGERDVAS